MRVLCVMCLLLAATASAVLAQTAEPQYTEDRPLQLTDPGDAVRHLLYARPFTLEKPYTYGWTKEKREITSGYLLVVEVDPAYARGRDIGMPVLYVGRRPAEVTNGDYQTGRLVVIVPGDADLAREPIFYGSDELPEKVTNARGQEEMQAALAMGMKPVPAAELRAALAKGGERLQVVDARDLYVAVADLIDEYAPSESDKAASYRAPRVESR